MKNIWMDDDGELVCPACGSRNLSYRRTRAAKLGGYLTVGVGVVAMPKRIQCIACREYFKSPAIARPRVAAPTATAVTAPGNLSSLGMEEGNVAVWIDDCEWMGATRLNMLRTARPGLTADAYARIQLEMLEKKPVQVALLNQESADLLVKRLQEHGFTARAEASSSQNGRSAADVLAQLERLGDLRDRGVLTDEEFAVQKARLLE